MYVSQAEVGAIALGQSNKMLQLTAMLLSFVDTTKELGGHYERIQTCHQTSGRTYTSSSHMHGNRTLGASTYTIWRGSIHGVLAAAAEAAVDAETTSALDLIGVTQIYETLQEQHWHKHCSTCSIRWQTTSWVTCKCYPY